MFRVSGLGLAVCRFRGGVSHPQLLHPNQSRVAVASSSVSGTESSETSWVSLRSVQAVAAGTVTVWVEKSGSGGGAKDRCRVLNSGFRGQKGTNTTNTRFVPGDLVDDFNCQERMWWGVNKNERRAPFL